jgi:hypothetical protein
LADVEALLKDKLNDKIAAIEAEKTAAGSPVGLPGVVDEAYFEQTWNNKVFNYAPAIFFGLESTQTEGIGPATSQLIKVFVEAIIVDSGNDNLGHKRLHRYSRALKEVFEEHFGDFPGLKTKIETVAPISFKVDEDSSDEVRVGGVSITTALA